MTLALMEQQNLIIHLFLPLLLMNDLVCFKIGPVFVIFAAV